VGKKNKQPAARPDILIEPDWGDHARTYHTRMLLANGPTDAIHKNSDIEDLDEYPELRDRDNGKALAQQIVHLRGVELVIIFDYSIKVVRAQLFDWDEDRIELDTLDALKAVLKLDTDSAEPIVAYATGEDDEGDFSKVIKPDRKRRRHRHKHRNQAPPATELPTEPAPDKPIDSGGDADNG
jgi:hypothetical protein